MVGVASGASGGGGGRAKRAAGGFWRSKSGGWLSPSEARLPPIGLAKATDCE